MKAVAYVDGSFNAATGTYGAGVVLLVEGKEPIYDARFDNNKIFAKSRNVAGEVLAAMIAISLCKEMEGMEELTIYYDYSGIECWVTGVWQARSNLAASYVDYVKDTPFPVKFRKVTAHTGVEYNEIADELAKKACGLI